MSRVSRRDIHEALDIYSLSRIIIAVGSIVGEEIECILTEDQEPREELLQRQVRQTGRRAGREGVT